jgi:hypothetical protein
MLFDGISRSCFLELKGYLFDWYGYKYVIVIELVRLKAGTRRANSRIERSPKYIFIWQNFKSQLIQTSLSFSTQIKQRWSMSISHAYWTKIIMILTCHSFNGVNTSNINTVMQSLFNWLLGVCVLHILEYSIAVAPEWYTCRARMDLQPPCPIWNLWHTSVVIIVRWVVAFHARRPTNCTTWANLPKKSSLIIERQKLLWFFLYYSTPPTPIADCCVCLVWNWIVIWTAVGFYMS